MRSFLPRCRTFRGRVESYPLSGALASGVACAHSVRRRAATGTSEGLCAAFHPGATARPGGAARSQNPTRYPSSSKATWTGVAGGGSAPGGSRVAGLAKTGARLGARRGKLLAADGQGVASRTGRWSSRSPTLPVNIIAAASWSRPNPMKSPPCANCWSG